MKRGSRETAAASPSAAVNHRVADALTDLTKLVRAHAHLPALTYITCTSHTDPPEIDLWVKRPEEVRTWARELRADVIEHDHSDEGTAFTITEAILTKSKTARVKLKHLAYHDKPVD